MNVCCSKSKRQTGFTLIEILVVLVILTIIIAAAAISIGEKTTAFHAKNAANRIKTIAPLASQEALLQSTLYGLMITPQQFQLFQFANGHWQPLPQALFGRYDLSSDIKIVLQINDNLVKLPDILIPPAPQILFSNAGDMTPFIMLIETRKGGALYQLKGQANGEIVTIPIQK